jgi:hypothetical protein
LGFKKGKTTVFKNTASNEGYYTVLQSGGDASNALVQKPKQ